MSDAIYTIDIHRLHGSGGLGWRVGHEKRAASFRRAANPSGELFGVSVFRRESSNHGRREAIKDGKIAKTFDTENWLSAISQRHINEPHPTEERT
jgi:hypothetical protein